MGNLAGTLRAQNDLVGARRRRDHCKWSRELDRRGRTQVEAGRRVAMGSTALVIRDVLGGLSPQPGVNRRLGEATHYYSPSAVVLGARKAAAASFPAAKLFWASHPPSTVSAIPFT